MATANFLQRWRSGGDELVYLAVILVPRADASQTDTLFLATRDCFVPADSGTGDPITFYGDFLTDVGPLHSPGALGMTDFGLCTCSLSLVADTPLTFPAGVGGPAIFQTIRASLSTHIWTNARVTLYRWLTGFSDAVDRQMFLKKAAVVAWTTDDRGGIVLSLRQNTDWNRPVIPRTNTRQEFPHAPDETIGATFETVLGNMAAVSMRRPWPKSYPTFPTNHKYYRMLNNAGGVGDRFSPALLVDTGRGGGGTPIPDAVVMAAGHKIDSVYDDAKGTSMWMDFDGALGLIDAVPFNNLPGTAPVGAGMKIPDGINTVYVGLLPISFNTNASPATGGALLQQARDIRNVLDPSDSTYAYLEKGTYEAIYPVFPEPNAMQGLAPVSYDVVIGYEGGSTLSGLALFIDNNPGSPLNVLSLPATSAPTILKTNSNYGLGNNWSITFIRDTHFTLRFGGGAGKAKIYFFGIILRCAPRRNVLKSEKVIGARVVSLQERLARGIAISMSTAMKPYSENVVIPAVTEMRGSFYSNLRGAVDDGGGTFTGTAGALIERAPDLMKWLLMTYGGVQAADIENGTNRGSFSLERSQFAVPSLYPQQVGVHALCVTESVDLLTVLGWLTGDSLSQMYLSPYDGKFKLHGWNPDRAVDYPYKFGLDDILRPGGPEVSMTPLTDVVTGIRISYAHDSYKNTKRTEVAVSDSRSVAGYDFWGLRDQHLTVVGGVNDRIDFVSNTADGNTMTARVLAITPNTYIPQSAKPPASGLDYIEGLAQQIKGQFSWAEFGDGTHSRYQVTWGTQVTSGYNDYMAFVVGGSTIRLITMPANDGTLTCEQLAAVVQAQITALGSPFGTVLFGYDRSVDKFWIQDTNLFTTIEIKCTEFSGVDYQSPYQQRSFWASLGWYTAGADRTIATLGRFYADDIRLEQHFAITNLGGSGSTPGPKFQFSLLFKTGASFGYDTLTPRAAADVIGFRPEDRFFDFSPSAGRSYCGDCPKGSLEKDMATAVALYGARRELSYEARSILDTRTALSLRDRIAALFRGPRTVIRFPTNKAPDIEQCNIIEFDDSLDNAGIPYASPGSDGKWVGKKFVVVEYEHNNGPASEATNIVAVDIARLAALVATVGTAVVLGGAAIFRAVT